MPLALGGWSTSTQLASRKALTATLTRHYRDEFIKEAHKVRIGFGLGSRVIGSSFRVRVFSSTVLDPDHVPLAGHAVMYSSSHHVSAEGSLIWPVCTLAHPSIILGADCCIVALVASSARRFRSLLASSPGLQEFISANSDPASPCARAAS